MTEINEHEIQLTNLCWICEILIDSDEKQKDHCHIKGKFGGAAHCNCNVNLKVIKKTPIIFHNLKGCGSHIILEELGKFDVNASVIPNGLEKYMAFILNKNVVFIDSMQFMKSSLEKLVKNLLDDDFKYLIQEIDSQQLDCVSV